MRLIVLSGLPGAGKSTLAEALGRALGVPVFAKDWLEATLKRAVLEGQLGYAGYELLTTLARRQLMLGQSAILDSVAGIVAVREQWRALAAEFGADWKVIEVRCSDEAAHRARLASRSRGIPGWHELTWDEVERVRGYFAPWDEPRLVIDSVDAADDNLRAAMRYLQANA